METVMAIVIWMGYLLVVVGFCATIYKTCWFWLNLHALSWPEVDKFSKKIIKQLHSEEFEPDVVVGIGRGGAVFGAILSGNMRNNKKSNSERSRNIPLLVIERAYEWKDSRRYEVEIGLVVLEPLQGKRVLVVAGDVMTGGTMKHYLDSIEGIGVKAVKTACLVKGVAATIQPDFFGKQVPANFRLPWMFKGYGYIRDSREVLNAQNIFYPID